MKKIGLIIVSMLMIGGTVFYIISNDQPDQERVVDTTEESKNFFDFRPSSNGSVASSDSSEVDKTEPSSSIDDQTGDSRSTEESTDERSGSLAFLDVNHKLFDAYYGEGDVEERNKQLRNILSEPLHNEYLVSDNSEVLSESISEFDYSSFYNQEDSHHATVVNILEMVSDGLDQQLLVTVELEFNGKWLISDLKFKLIYG